MTNLWIPAPLAPHPVRPLLPPEFAMVTRHVSAGSDRLAAILADPAVTTSLRRLALGDGSWLSLGTPPARRDAKHPEWHASARIVGTGLRLVRFSRIEIRLSVWAHDVIQLEIRPTCRHPTRWGTRRLRRYFDSAHAAGDRLQALLEDVDRCHSTPIALPVPDEPRPARSAPAA